MRITCPYCGTRDQSEFQFGGEANVVRPENPEQASDAEWADYLFYRENTKGQHHERWVHGFGCGQWFQVVRDTVSHEILGSTPLGEPPSRDKTPSGGGTGE